MKNHKLPILVLCFAASAIFAQTADQYVAAGRTALVNHNLAGAYSNFNAAVTLSPANETANALLAVTRLLVLPQQPAGSNFLNRLGFSASGRDLYNWTATLPQDTNGGMVIPANFNSSEVISFFRTTVMSALGASRTNLARITDTNFTLSLTADETSTESVTVDYGDILLLQALGRAGEFLGYTLSAHNFSVVINHLKDLGNMEPGQLTIQRVLADYPSLLTQSSASDLAASKGAFTNASILYLAASDFIRNSRPAGAQRLFNLDTNDDKTMTEEAKFRDSLAKAVQSLNGPVQFNTNDEDFLYLGNYFAGTKSLRSLTPQFIGNRYVYTSLPDYTFGGLLLGEPACDTETLLRKLWDRPYAGIYTGSVSDSYYGGAFAAFLGTDMQAVIVGYDDDIGSSAFARFSVHDGGDWYFETNGLSDSGPFNISSYGSFNEDGSFYGEFDYFTTNGFYLFSQYLNGDLSSPLGGFQGSAGYYSGSWSGGGESGKLYGVLSADGQLYYSTFQSNGRIGSGGAGQLGSTYHFTNTDMSGTIVSGTLTPSTHTFSGTFVSPDISGTWSMSRSASAPFDVPPVITLPPADKIASLGTNVTFSLVVTGSPPLCYQWYSNNVAIAKATSPSLVLSNVTYASAAFYSVSIRNVVGETNATVRLTVISKIPDSFSLLDYYYPIYPGNQWVYDTQGTGSPKALSRIDAVSFPLTCFTGRSPVRSYVRNVIKFYDVNGDYGPGGGFVPVDTDYDYMIVDTNWGLIGEDSDVSGTTEVRFDPGLLTPTNRVTIGQTFSSTSDTYVNGSYYSPAAATFNFKVLEYISVTVPAGSFLDCLHIRYTLTTGGETQTNEEWWAKGVGMVKETIKASLTTGVIDRQYELSEASFASPPRITKPPQSQTINLGMTGGFSVEVMGSDPLGYQWQKNGVLLSDSGTISGTASTNLVIANAQFADAGSYSIVVSNAYGIVTSAPPAALTIVDANPPGLTITSHANLQLLGLSAITLSGTASDAGRGDNGIAFVKVNGIRATNDTASGAATASWSRGLGLSLGTNIISVIASDTHANSATNIIRIISDTTQPTLSITNLAAGQRVTNAVFTVKGTASDNLEVGNVICQLNNSGWTNTSGTTAWSIPFALTPGTNRFTAFAVDTIGNHSATTNSLSFQYVVTNQLVVQAIGLGTLSQNYSNAWLEIGRSYVMTATPAAGFIFTNWIISTNSDWNDGMKTNNATVQFRMASNLTLQVNFVDTAKPALSITNLTAGQRVTNAVFTVKGTATDNWQISNVVCRLNGGEWNSATNFNRWTNWSAGVTLLPGTNMVQVYATDTTGNTSVTNSLNFQYVVTNQLGLQKVGLGTLSPTNQLLELGRNYSIVATPATGFVVTNWMKSTNWLGGVQTNNATVQFMMVSNLTLQVTFADVSKPTLTISAPANLQKMTNALATVVGTTADNWKVSGVWYQLNSNAWTLVTTTTNSYTNWTQTVTLLAGTNTMKAFAVDLGGNYSPTGSVSVISSNTFQLLLRFTAPQPLTSTGLNFGLQLSPGLNGRIQTSTNLANWITLTNFVGTNASLNFRDPGATNLNRRFYRAVVP